MTIAHSDQSGISRLLVIGIATLLATGLMTSPLPPAGAAGAKTSVGVVPRADRPTPSGALRGHGPPVPLGPRAATPPDDGTLPGDEGPAVTTDAIETGHSVATIAPGVTLRRERTYDASGFVDSYVLTADLNGPTIPRLLNEGVSNVEVPTDLADRAGAVAATNGDFFAINTTNAPIGPMVRSGELLKANAEPQTVVGLDATGAGQIADLLLEGEATISDTTYPLSGLNANQLPADSVGLYTPAWGQGDRAFVRTQGAVAEIEVQHGVVTEVRAGASGKPVPEDGLVLIATGSDATALGDLAAGTPVEADYHARSDAPSAFSLALGAHLVLLRDGTRQPIDLRDPTNSELKPRTAIGWTANHRLLLFVADGSSSRSRGLTAPELADRMQALGAIDAVMLDGGGSSQLVSRRPGDTATSVTNAPSDGGQRNIPNAVGLVPPSGSGTLYGLDVRLRSTHLFPGLSRDVYAAGFDEAYGPVDAGDVAFRTEPDRLAGPGQDGFLRGGQPGTGLLTARTRQVGEQVAIRVLGPLDRLESDAPALSLPPGEFRDVAVTGRDAEGFSAPIEPRDLDISYDVDVLEVSARPDGRLRITGRPDAEGKGSLVTITVQGHSLRIPVTVGLADVAVSSLADASQWRASAARATASVTSVDTSDRPGAAADERGLRLSYDFTGQPIGTSAAYAVATTPLLLPAGTQRLAMWVKGDGRRHWLRAQVKAQGSTNVPFTFAQEVDWTGWRRIEGAVPTGFTAPFTLERIYLVETDSTKRDAGQLDFALLDARVGVALDLPDVADQPDPAIVEQGLPAPADGLRFAILSDTHVNADGGTGSYAYRQTAQALDEIAAARPEFVLLSGDGVDSNRPQDFALFQDLLDDHLPASIPLRWAVGNHESGATAGGTLDQFTASTGRPSRQVFDQRGTRFILLNSTLGSLRLSDWSQIPWLQQQLRSAASDGSISSVVVAAHHPVLDPTGTGASQLSDPYEGQFLEQLLADFRAGSGKQVALVTGHAHTAHVRRVDGVLEFNAPVVGKVPYGDAGHGGFAAWSLVTLDEGRAGVDPDRFSPAGLDWFRADVRPLLSRVELDPPGELPVNGRVVVSANAVDEGQGGRVVPLRYPMSVTWSGSRLAVVDDSRGFGRARRDRDVVAVLDLRTMTLTGLRRGAFTLSVQSGLLRATRDGTVT